MFPRLTKCIAAFSLLIAGSTVAFGQQEASRPLFVNGPIYPAGSTTVFGVAGTPVTDVVILNNGLDEGFRMGMVCKVSRVDTAIAELILVDVRENRAAALILNLENGQAIRSGDDVKIKTITL